MAIAVSAAILVIVGMAMVAAGTVEVIEDALSGLALLLALLAVFVPWGALTFGAVFLIRKPVGRWFKAREFPSADGEAPADGEEQALARAEAE